MNAGNSSEMESDTGAIELAISRPFDEPLILQQGQKMIRTYLHDALPSWRDDRVRGLFEKCFTNSLLRQVFELARRGQLGLYPNWLPRYFMCEPLCSIPAMQELVDHGHRHEYEKRKLIRTVRKFDKGLVILIAMAYAPVNLFLDSEETLRKVFDAIRQHPTVKYLLMYIAHIANINIYAHMTLGLDMDMEEYAYRHYHFDPPATPAGWMAKRPDIASVYRREVGEVEQAVFSGNLDYFKKGLTDEDRDAEDDYQIQENILDCRYCGMRHNVGGQQ